MATSPDQRRIRTIAYSGGRVIDQDFDPAQIAERLSSSDEIVWIDFTGPTSADLGGIVAELGLHELAVEDALGPHQRPKLDHYPSHLFMACHYVTMDKDTATLDAAEVDVFIGERWLITVHQMDRFPVDRVRARYTDPDLLSEAGIAYLVHGLLDLVIDRYMDVVEVFDAYFSTVAEDIFAEHPIDPADQRHWFMMGRALSQFHRVVPPVREVVSSLMRRDDTLVSGAIRPYYQDLYDHVITVGESTDSLRDLLSAIVATNLSVRDYRQNRIMKKVTSWAAIIAVPTLVTGIYGMNVPFPGVDEVWGVIVSMGLIISLSLILYVVFRTRDWL